MKYYPWKECFHIIRNMVTKKHLVLFLGNAKILVDNVMLVPRSVPKIWTLELGAYGSVLELGDVF